MKQRTIEIREYTTRLRNSSRCAPNGILKPSISDTVSSGFVSSTPCPCQLDQYEMSIPAIRKQKVYDTGRILKLQGTIRRKSLARFTDMCYYSNQKIMDNCIYTPGNAALRVLCEKMRKKKKFLSRK